MGNKLYGQVTAATGLPQEIISDELDRLLLRAGLDRNDLTLDDLRKVLADYVQDVLLDTKEQLLERAVGE